MNCPLCDRPLDEYDDCPTTTLIVGSNWKWPHYQSFGQFISIIRNYKYYAWQTESYTTISKYTASGKEMVLEMPRVSDKKAYQIISNMDKYIAFV